jgi:cyclic-di-GMP-binding protein
MPSFDVVSRVDMQEVDNAVNQARKELNTRYDFKGSKSSIDIEENTITVLADDKMKLEALIQIIKQKMVKREIGLKSLEFKDPEEASGGMIRQKIEIKQGISTEEGKKMVKIIKDQNLKKVQTQIQDEQLRVTAPKRDDLQAVIALLKEKATLELQFVNFRD